MAVLRLTILGLFIWSIWPLSIHTGITLTSIVLASAAHIGIVLASTAHIGTVLTIHATIYPTLPARIVATICGVTWDGYVFSGGFWLQQLIYLLLCERHPMVRDSEVLGRSSLASPRLTGGARGRWAICNGQGDCACFSPFSSAHDSVPFACTHFVLFAREIHPSVIVCVEHHAHSVALRIGIEAVWIQHEASPDWKKKHHSHYCACPHYVSNRSGINSTFQGAENKPETATQTKKVLPLMYRVFC